MRKRTTTRIVLPPPVFDRVSELERVAAEHEERRRRGARQHAEHVIAHLSKWQIRELRDPDILREFVILIIEI